MLSSSDSHRSVWAQTTRCSSGVPDWHCAAKIREYLWPLELWKQWGSSLESAERVGQGERIDPRGLKTPSVSLLGLPWESSTEVPAYRKGGAARV